MGIFTFDVLTSVTSAPSRACGLNSKLKRDSEGTNMPGGGAEGQAAYVVA